VADELSSSSKHALSPLAPEGHWAIKIEGKNRTTRFSYNDAHQKIPIGDKYDNLNLNKDVFPLLGVFGEDASLGMTSTQVELDSNYLTMMLGYGISKNLTVGIILPYREKTTKVNFSVSGGNIGVNPNFDNTQAVSATNSPYLPSSINGITPITTNQLQHILSSLGYQPLQTIKVSGLADPTIGFLWNAHKTKEDTLVLSMGYDIALAKKDDPNNLMPTNVGNGNAAIRFRMEYFKDLEYDFDIFAKMEYGLELKDKIKKRVPLQGKFLATKESTERLERKIGNYRVYDIGLGKTWKDYRLSSSWRRSEKNSDHYYSSKGTDVSYLGNNSDASASLWENSLSWSGIDSWRKGELAIPLVVTLSYRDTYKGKNSLKWKEIYLNVTSFF